ncbi:MAG: hypothetical protein IPM82_21305 [Saprospiraceae bacterium]|nr:hypothetical protein [Saprospiraceae bacterium]
MGETQFISASGEVFLLSHGGWQERWKISLPSHGKTVFTSGGVCCSDMDSGTTTLNTGRTWSATHDGTNDKIYFNGVEVATKLVAGALMRRSSAGIGYDPIGNGSFFDGSIDDVQIANFALSGLQVAAAYAAQNTFPGTASTLVAGYSLNGNGNDDSDLPTMPSSTQAWWQPQSAWLGWQCFLQGAATAANSAALQSDYTTINFGKTRRLPSFRRGVHFVEWRLAGALENLPAQPRQDRFHHPLGRRLLLRHGLGHPACPRSMDDGHDDTRRHD